MKTRTLKNQKLQKIQKTQQPQKSQEPKQVAFTCCQCNQDIGDSLYNRFPHAPSNLCFDCWCNEWEDLRAYKSHNGGEWTRKDTSLWLVAAGYAQQEIADILKVNVKTLYLWRKELRANPPLWIEYILAQEKDKQRQRKEYSRRNNKYLLSSERE